MRGALSRPAAVHCWRDLRGDLCTAGVRRSGTRWGPYVGPSERGGRIRARERAPISPSARRDGGEAFLGREEKPHFAIMPGALHLSLQRIPRSLGRHTLLVAAY